MDLFSQWIVDLSVSKSVYFDNLALCNKGLDSMTTFSHIKKLEEKE